jgi:hypothetical protein
MKVKIKKKMTIWKLKKRILNNKNKMAKQEILIIIKVENKVSNNKVIHIPINKMRKMDKIQINKMKKVIKLRIHHLIK